MVTINCDMGEAFGLYKMGDDEGLMPLIDELHDANWDSSKMSAYNVQLVAALKFPIRSASDAYNALHAVTDFVSGMTDRYAVKVADMIGRR